VSQNTIVVIEDETDIAAVIEHNLSRAGYKVTCQTDGLAGAQTVRQELPTLVLLDLMLPGIDGLEVCKRLKADPQTARVPIVMLTARGEEVDIVRGLELGADDYITKPFRPGELVARIKAVLRRVRGPEPSESSSRLVRGGVSVDTEKFVVQIDGQLINFTTTELKLLHLLMLHPGRVFTRDHLLSRVMGPDAVVIDRNIDVHIRAIRQKLGAHRDLIETVRGVGYRSREEAA
jgi:two-component system alkaline phosphatase synthesis response regulator PhoP